MNIGEANDLNTVLRYVLNLPDITRSVPADDKARDAAARLADKAHKGIMAGLTGDDVVAAWPELLLDNGEPDPLPGSEADFEAREAQAAYDDEWIGRRA